MLMFPYANKIIAHKEKYISKIFLKTYGNIFLREKKISMFFFLILIDYNIALLASISCCSDLSCYFNRVFMIFTLFFSVVSLTISS